MRGIEHIDEVHAFIVRDHDGTEGVPAVSVCGVPVMLMTAGATATGEVVGRMREWAKQAAAMLEPGQTMTHVVFRDRCDLEVI